MRSFAILRTALAAGLIGLLAGCGAGGGGGSSAYTITLRADKTSLPLNIANATANIGGPYTTTLYVDAKDSAGNPIPGGTGTFGCAVVNNLDSGALYYLDGKAEHQTTTTTNGVSVTTPNAYRSITLDSNSGGATFHYTSTDVAGLATIRCSVTDPDKVQRSADVSIQVGGSPSGKVSQVVAAVSSPNYLWVQGMNGQTQLIIQEQIVDEAGQPVVAPTGVNNLQVSIIPDSSTLAENDALLRGVNAAGQTVSGSSIQVRSINGLAQITLVSGTNPGTITLQAISDRADNNVDNGVSDPVYNFSAVPVVNQSPSSSTPVTLAVTTTSLPAATGNVPYGAVLAGSGGTPPYTWTLVSGIVFPISGLSLSSNGVISGTPYSTTSGTYNFVVQMTDSAHNSIQQGLSIVYTAPPVTPPVATSPTIVTSSLSGATVGQTFTSVLTASGTAPFSWTAVGLPPGLIMNSTGVVSGIPTTAGNYTFAATVSDGTGLSTTKAITMVVSPATSALTIMTTKLADGKVSVCSGTPIVCTNPYSAQLNGVGGNTSGYIWSVSQLPAGLSLASATGVISGYPTAAATGFTFTATLTDGTTPISKSFTINILP
jgi:hypothetical protein